jgi:hypothetical protein
MNEYTKHQPDAPATKTRFRGGMIDSFVPLFVMRGSLLCAAILFPTWAHAEDGPLAEIMA